MPILSKTPIIDTFYDLRPSVRPNALRSLWGVHADLSGDKVLHVIVERKEELHDVGEIVKIPACHFFFAPLDGIAVMEAIEFVATELAGAPEGSP